VIGKIVLAKRNAQTLVYPLLLGWVAVWRQLPKKKQANFFSTFKGGIMQYLKDLLTT